jgi:DNA invertase Pin-like site-specific DNA recombinase
MVAGYIRVSRVGGREGESFISPDVQAESIHRWCTAHSLELGEVVVELDVSGGKTAEERELGRLIDACEAGELEGVVVWNLSRFGRKLSDVIRNVERITEAGARFVAVEDGIDTGSKTSKLLIGIFGTLAEIERDSRAEGWLAAKESAIKRGVHITVPPFGYDKTPEGKLVMNEHAMVVRRAFGMRSDRRSWSEIAAYIEEQTGRRFSHSSLHRMIQSRTYLGEVYSGEFRQEGAHEPIISTLVWEAAQWKGTQGRGNGLVKGSGILTGLIECASCGKTMARSTNGNSNVTYTCRTNRQGGECESPSSGTVSLVDALVEPGIIERLSQVPDRSAEAKRAALAFQAAWRELDAFLEHASVAVLGERYSGEVERRREAVRLTSEKHTSMIREWHQGFPSPDEWDGVPIERKREVAASLVESVKLRRSDRKNQALKERISIQWS